jgi:hypothetical protein
MRFDQLRRREFITLLGNTGTSGAKLARTAQITSRGTYSNIRRSLRE